VKIQIIGIGCAKCRQTEANAREAIKNLGIDAEVEKITDVNEIADFGIISTPGLAVDGNVKFSGKVPTVAEIKKILE